MAGYEMFTHLQALKQELLYSNTSLSRNVGSEKI